MDTAHGDENVYVPRRRSTRWLLLVVVSVLGCLPVLLWTCLILSVVPRHLVLDRLVLGHVGAKIFSGVGDVGLLGMILKKWILDMVM